MTNAEKFEEVFGFEPSKCKCPAEVCTNCPVNPCRNSSLVIIDWWNSEYKESAK